MCVLIASLAYAQCLRKSHDLARLGSTFILFLIFQSVCTSFNEGSLIQVGVIGSNLLNYLFTVRTPMSFSGPCC